MNKLILHYIYNTLLFSICFALNLFIFQPQASKSKIEVDIVDRFMKSDTLQMIAKRESNFDSTVISSADCMGLYQIHPMYFFQLGINPHSLIIPDWNTPNHKGRFIMSIEEQNRVCRHFIKEQIKFLQSNNIPVTIHNIYMSWYGTGLHLFKY